MSEYEMRKFHYKKEFSLHFRKISIENFKFLLNFADKK